MTELFYISGSNGAIYMTRDGAISIELTSSAMWGFFEWGIMVDAAFDIDALCERHNVIIR